MNILTSVVRSFHTIGYPQLYDPTKFHLIGYPNNLSERSFQTIGFPRDEVRVQTRIQNEQMVAK